jgi:hypothetical protein
MNTVDNALDVPSLSIPLIFTQMASCLLQSDLAKLPSINRTFLANTQVARAHVRHLDLSRTPFNSLRNGGLLRILSDHPIASGLDLSGATGFLACESDHEERASMFSQLAVGLGGRALTHLNLSTQGRHIEVKRGSARSLQWAGLVDRINFTLMEIVSFQGITGLGYSFLNKLIYKFSTCSQLCRITCYEQSYIPPAKELFFKSLPRSLTYLDFSGWVLSDRILKLIVTRFDPIQISGCRLSGYSTASRESLMQFLEFLPLSKMEEIYFERFDLTPDLLLYLISKLTINPNLKTLKILECKISFKISQVEALIRSLNSEHVVEVDIQGLVVLDSDELMPALRSKLPTWKSDRKLCLTRYIDNLLPDLTAPNSNGAVNE